MSVFDEMTNLRDAATAAIAAAGDAEALEQVRIEYLGRSGALKAMMGRIKDVPKEQKKDFGQGMNEIKAVLTTAFEARQAELATAQPTGSLIDPTLPGKTTPLGTLHPLTQTIDRVASIFERLGFSIADGPEIEDSFHNFEALNIPPDHPARDDQDTFVLTGEDRIMRSQTSTVQIRVMQAHTPPVRVIAPGRVYRPDTVDATHHYGFQQIEGLAVDTDITFADLKGLLGMFAKELFGENTQTRFRPSFFPFTEPSAEVDVSCPFCTGETCRVCRGAKWIEILGCGMVDPNVFRAVGYDPERYTGFAFGMGVERLAMLTLGVNDIRRFFENDLRFLRQF